LLGECQNVALLSNGATCSANRPNCEEALDGISESNANAYRWEFVNPAQGTQIQISFRQTYIITAAVFTQLYFADDSNFKHLQLYFSDGSFQLVISIVVNNFVLVFV
jgi:hypothetical protein